MDQEFGGRLRELRMQRGLSQAELAGDTLAASYVSLLESGKRSASRKIAAELAQRLSVDVDYLLTGVAETQREERGLALRFAELELHNGQAGAARDGFVALLSDADIGSQEHWRIQHGLARANERMGRLEQAVELLEEMSEQASAEPTQWPWLEVIMDLSRCYREAGDLARACSLAEAAVERARRIGLDQHPDLPRLIATWVAACRERGDLAHARYLLNRMLGEMNETTPRRARAGALWSAALNAKDYGEYAEAKYLADRAIQDFVEEADIRDQAGLRNLMAVVELALPDGDASAALALLLESQHQLSQAGMQIETAYTETELARAEAALEQPESAIAWARSAIERLGDTDRLETIRARLALARGLIAHDETRVAAEEMQVASAALADLGASRQAAAAWRELAELEAAVGNMEGSQASFAHALDALGVPGAHRINSQGRASGST